MLSAIPFRYASGAGFIRSLTPAAWYRFNTGITSNAGAVSQWADQSGNDRHLVQATATNQPTLEADGSITFDGVDNFLRVAFTLDQPCTMYALLQVVTFSATDFLFSGAATNSRLAQAASAPDLNWSAGSALPISGEVADGTWFAFAGTFNGASSAAQINAGTVTTGDAGALNPGGITLGANAGGTNLFGNVKFKEFICYASAHDAATRARVIRYLMQVGGL